MERYILTKNEVISQRNLMKNVAKNINHKEMMYLWLNQDQQLVKSDMWILMKGLIFGLLLPHCE